MDRTGIGLIWAFSFVILEAAQAVFFGSVFQNHDSFLIGAIVFGLSASGMLIWSSLRNLPQLRIAWSNKATLTGLNLSTAVVWVAYFYGLQIVEPAVVFTIFSGVVPISILFAAACGVKEASPLRNRIEGFGITLVLIAMLYLCVITLMGLSGFVRGGLVAALIGLGLTGISGASLAAMMIYSQRLDRIGVKPTAQYGLRFPVYVFVAFGAAALGLDSKGPVDSSTLGGVILVGLLIMAFPVFAMQKAISLMPTLTLAAITALGPLFVFVFQLFEGRVNYAPATMLGLAIYFSGALLAAYGGAKRRDGPAVYS